MLKKFNIYKIKVISLILLILIGCNLVENVHSYCFPRKLWHVERHTLHFPDLNEMAHVLSKQLKSQFHYVKTEVANSPDLREEPFLLTTAGLTGSTRVLDIGSLSNLVPRPNLKKSYSLVDMMSIAELNTAYAFGAGAGPFKQLGYNSEGVYNFNVRDCTLHQHSASIRVTNLPNGTFGYKLLNLNDSQTDVGFLCNLFASKGHPGKVVQLHLKQRINSTFVLGTGLRHILRKHFGSEKPIGVGLVGLFKNGVADTSVMPTFSEEPVENFADWVKHFNTSAPFVMLGTILTEDQGLNLYTPHIHFRNEHQGGHFINDISPEDVEYVIYLSPAEYIYRVDQPGIAKINGN
ncbi:ester hydrolase C11orf54 homolog [Atheta coriaria]|uniref:ester hydrolase C11orf54 homolog n=1 Tax=Dalotia coriaria TaxID=877792 RepID=UPI0031F428DE